MRVIYFQINYYVCVHFWSIFQILAIDISECMRREKVTYI